MNLLTSSNLRQFHERFSNCYDALITSINIVYPGRSSDGSDACIERVGVTLTAHQFIGQPDDAWVSLKLDLQNVHTLKLVEGDRTSVVLSGGVTIAFADDLTYVAFDAIDLDTPADFESADFFIVAEQCTWSVSPLLQ